MTEKKKSTDELILEELREIKEILSLTTADGTPLRNLLPSPEFVAAATIAAGLLAQESPSFHPLDLDQRIKSAVQIALLLVKNFDEFQRLTAADRLNLLFTELGAGQ